jgi:uncharacterized protein
MAVEFALILALLALVMETVDSSLGMMYGTLLSPVLVGWGFDPLVVIPAILVSQAVGGCSGMICHHIFRNADFNGLTRDTKVALAMILPGFLAIALGVLVAVSLPKFWIKLYIAMLVMMMSILCLTRLRFTFAWWKHYMVGTIAAFNKALSGGGFGPVTSTGGIIGGLEARVSIATTTFAEVFICLASFGIYCFVVDIDVGFSLWLCVGAFIGGTIGPYINSRVNHLHLRWGIGILGIVSGIWLLWRMFLN